MVVLQWTAQNATALVSSNFGAAGLTGSVTVSPPVTTSYTLTVSGANGQTATGSVTVRVDTVAVAVSPSPAAVDVSQSLSFAATITGAVDTRVIWSVLETGGGTITAAGVYTAPAIGGDYHIVATSNADSRQSVTVPVHVRAASGGVTIN